MDVNINDFKLLNLQSKHFFELFAQAESIDNSILSRLTEVQKYRYGFYFYILEMITEVSDLSDIAEMITDTEFNSAFYGDRSNDEGIDAVYINDEKNVIQLFSFKYREKFNVDQSQRKNELLESTKFLCDINVNDYHHTSGKTHDYLEQICKRFFESPEPWSIELFFVTNDTKSIDPNDPNIKNLKKVLSLSTKFISLTSLAKQLTKGHEPICSELVMDDEALMSYKEGTLSSDTSYILRLSLTDIIRITCDDADFRSQTDIYEKDKLANAQIAYDVLSDNVRGFILKSEYNKNISETIEEDPSKFFMYNNGITIIASDVKVTPFPNGKKSKVLIENLQVLNGGQTLRTIHKYNQINKQSGLSNLQKAEILVRVFKVTDKDLMNKIAEYTNSQNAISNRDLKSISSEQIKLEKYLDSFEILYIRKYGDTGLVIGKQYSHTISMEKLGQILYAVMGNPESATNKKRQIFDNEYARLFQNDDLLSEKTVAYINDYYLFKDLYKKELSKKPSEQKVFYLLYLKQRVKLENLKLIKEFEKIMSKYSDLDSYQINRQLITPQFKSELDKHFSISES